MELTLIDNAVYTRQLGLDTTIQKKSADLMYDLICDKFDSSIDDGYSNFNEQIPITTKVYSKYNYFLYPVPGNYELFNKIKETFYQCLKHSNWNVEPHYYIQAWLNYYKKGEYIDWHSHAAPSMKGWHGFYCVDVEPNSKTMYRFPDKEQITNVQSKNDLVVISPSNNDSHRSSEWNEEKPRITIAFDIIPQSSLFAGARKTNNLSNTWKELNHWIPL
jgi:hypothetical protein